MGKLRGSLPQRTGLMAVRFLCLGGCGEGHEDHTAEPPLFLKGCAGLDAPSPRGVGEHEVGSDRSDDDDEVALWPGDVGDDRRAASAEVVDQGVRGYPVAAGGETEDGHRLHKVEGADRPSQRLPSFGHEPFNPFKDGLFGGVDPEILGEERGDGGGPACVVVRLANDARVAERAVGCDEVCKGCRSDGMSGGPCEAVEHRVGRHAGEGNDPPKEARGDRSCSEKEANRLRRGVTGGCGRPQPIASGEPERWRGEGPSRTVVGQHGGQRAWSMVFHGCRHYNT